MKSVLVIVLVLSIAGWYYFTKMQPTVSVSAADTPKTGGASSNNTGSNGDNNSAGLPPPPTISDLGNTDKKPANPIISVAPAVKPLPQNTTPVSQLKIVSMPDPIYTAPDTKIRKDGDAVNVASGKPAIPPVFKKAPAPILVQPLGITPKNVFSVSSAGGQKVNVG